MLTSYRDGLRTSIRTNATAYGFSVMITCTFGLVQQSAPVTTPRVLIFLFSAGIAFTTVEAAVSNLFRQRLRGERSDVVFLGTAFNLVSVAAGVAAAWIVALAGMSMLSWAVAPFAATLVYLLVGGLEMALAREIEQREDARAG